MRPRATSFGAQFAAHQFFSRRRRRRRRGGALVWHVRH